MSELAIQVDSLAKQYQIGLAARRHDTLRDHIVYGVKALIGRTGRNAVESDRDTEFWALQHVSFNVNKGEVLGVIGGNGAGKSTLLKILSRITYPTKGRVEIRGRLGALLEVGTGFSGELTGRENVLMNGAILGMKKQEIDKKFDAIVDFAEVEKFIDTPVKHYSSGMYMRLAFAVAAHLEPEILIIDEVLAVGDAQFQKKCLGKMDEVAKEGRTVLFVSHNLVAVANLCRSALWLEAGRLRERGPARDIVRKYLLESSQKMSSRIDVSKAHRLWNFGQDLRLVAVEWLSEIPLHHSHDVKARIYIEAHVNLEDVNVTLGFSTDDGTRLLSYDTCSEVAGRPRARPGDQFFVEVDIKRFPLPPGTYLLDIVARRGQTHTLDYLPGFARMEVAVGNNTPAYISTSTGINQSAQWEWKP